MKKLFGKIQKVTNEVKGIKKDLVVGQGKSAYKAVSDTAVIMAINDAEQKHGLVSIPACEITILDSSVEKVVGYNGKENLVYIDTIKMLTKIYDIETGECISIESIAKGIDYQDKGLGKAMTYARKYALLNAYKIPTGEELDNDKSNPEEPAPSKEDKRVQVRNYFDKHTDDLQSTLAAFNLGSFDELNSQQINSLYVGLKGRGEL